MFYLLALGSAALYGAADFLGGLASRRASTIAIVALSQASGLVPLGVLLLVLPSSPVPADFVWGAIAGVGGSIGVALLYRALAVGTMSVVAPTTAVCAVLLPVLVEALRGERLAPATMGGIALALVAIVLIGQSTPSEGHAGALHGPGTPVPARRTMPPGLDLAFLSGIAIGLFFLALARTSPDAGLWPLLASRSLCLVVFGGYVMVTAGTLRLSQPVLGMTLWCGVIDMLANACYVLATHGGSLSIIVTLASLYPASTVVLARLVVGERLSRIQAAGMFCALVAVVLIVSSS